MSENVEVVRRVVDAYNRRDIQAMQAEAHPDVVLDWSASRGLDADVYRGYDETTRFFMTMFDVFEQVRIEPDRFIESGDLVLVPNTTVVRGRDGIETSARSCMLYELRGGQVVRACLYQETGEALEAAGLSDPG